MLIYQGSAERFISDIRENTIADIIQYALIHFGFIISFFTLKL